MELDHVGVATEDAHGLAERYTDLLGASRVHEGTVDGMAVVFLALGGCHLEILEPLEGGVIADYLDREGPGLHHLAAATDDIEDALARARELGVELVDERPREGARGRAVAFLHPASTGGVLWEFVER